MDNRKPIEAYNRHESHIYQSITEASKALGANRYTLRKRLKDGCCVKNTGLKVRVHEED